MAAEEDAQRTKHDHESESSTASRRESTPSLVAEQVSSPKENQFTTPPDFDNEDGEVNDQPAEPANPSDSNAEQPLPHETTPPPLPDEPPPALQDPQDDGWEPVWDDTSQAFYFYNRFTHVTQWENPRVPQTAQPTNHDRIPAPTRPLASNGGNKTEEEVHPAVAGGYNPAIHGSYDPNAPYAQYATPAEDVSGGPPDDVPPGVDPADYTAEAHFNRFTGRFQTDELQPSNFNDESRARRQMNAFFNVDDAANSHDGRSLKAERQGRKLTKQEVKQFRERRREKKEEKRRAWLRD